MTETPENESRDSADDPGAGDRADRDHEGEDAFRASDPGITGRIRGYAPGGTGGAPQAAGVAGAIAAAVLIQRRKEASRPRFQQWIGASPRRRNQEELAVKAGTLAAGTLAHVLVAGAMAGTRRYRDRKARIADARLICQVVGLAAQAPDGSIPAGGRVILKSALKGTDLGDRTRKRLLAEPLPADIEDLEPCPLQGELL